LLEWLNNPADGPTWRRGSIRLGPDGAGYERMACPTMLIVGWADGYRNNSFRVIEQYERNALPWRLLAGPWVHKSPERARPGPNVDDDVEVLAFFDRHLARHDLARRAVRCSPPAGATRARSGVPSGPLGRRRHVAVARTPPRAVRHRTTASALQSRATSVSRRGTRVVVRAVGQPLDGAETPAATCWPRTRGAGRHRPLSPRVRSDHDYGHVSVKLHVLPDGSSALRGMLDLRHRNAGRPIPRRGRTAAGPWSQERGSTW
jgi:predicted acyl esterase